MTTCPYKISLARSLPRAELLAISALLDSVGMRAREPRKLARAIDASTGVVVARTSDRSIVGFGRLVGDDTYYAGIWDVAVRPDWQGRGVGRSIVQRLIAVAERQGLHMTGLFTSSENFSFYESHEFSVARHIHAMIRREPT
jgi:GNAT superfamily N-acetyltransferase